MITLLLYLVIAGVCLYLVNAFVPMAPPIKTVINVIVVLILVVLILNTFGLTHIHAGNLN